MLRIFVATMIAVLWLTDPLSDRQVQMMLTLLLLFDLVSRLPSHKRAQSPIATRILHIQSPTGIPPLHVEDDQDAEEFLAKFQSLLRDNASLISENAALSITIKNLSDKHTLLCEIRSTLSRQRRDSKELMTLILTTALVAEDEHLVSKSRQATAENDSRMAQHSVSKSRQATATWQQERELDSDRPTKSV